MKFDDQLFSEIEDPIARKRAIAESAGKAIQQIIEIKGAPFSELQDKLNYLKRALDTMKDL